MTPSFHREQEAVETSLVGRGGERHRLGGQAAGGSHGILTFALRLLQVNLKISFYSQSTYDRENSHPHVKA